MKETVELLNLFKELGYSDSDAERFWKKTYLSHREKVEEYKKKPIRERKDNKDVINYGGGSAHYFQKAIRYPKKVRKTAWKRFYKLFPHLDPKNKDKNK